MRTILVNAYACEPFKGSEQGVGWNWVLQLAKENVVHVITRANNRTIIEENIPKEYGENLYFHYYDTPEVIRKLKKRAKGLYFYYFCWQIGVIQVISKLSKQHRFDYAIQLTLGSIWMPTFLPFFKIPFIWGPLGGGEGIPKAFLSSLPIKQRFIQTARYILKYFAHIHPFILHACNNADAILVRTSNTLEFIPKRFRSKTKIVLETSIEEQVFEYKRTTKQSPFELIFTGRLVPFKNVLCLVHALDYISEHYQYNLTIIGSGSEKEKLKKHLRNKPHKHRVTFHEEMPREQVLQKLSKSDIYVFPSLREGGSWALMEAMAVGVPVVCLNWTGMGIITDSKSAVHLPLSNPKQMPQDLARALCELMDQPERLKQIGDAGRERIRRIFNWNKKGEFATELFSGLELSKGKND